MKRRFVLASILAFGAVELVIACGGGDPAKTPTDPGTETDSGPSTDATKEDASGDTGGPSTDGGAFCTQHAGALCEDFEGTAFPPSGWMTQLPGAGSVEKAAGYESSGALAASHELAASNIEASLARDDFAIETKHKKLRLSARVRVINFGSPSSSSIVLSLRTAPGNPGKSISFAINSATSASLVVQDGSNGGAPFGIDSEFSLNAWHDIQIDVTRSPSYTIALRYDGKQIGAPVQIGSIIDGMKRVSLGVQSNSGAGARRVEIDNVLFEALE